MAFTTADYYDMLHRLRQSHPKTEEHVGAVDLESDLHSSILEYCKSHRWICWHGSMAHRTHRSKGEADFTILADGGRSFYVEAKARNGKLSTDQRGMAMWATGLGHTISIVTSMDEFRDLVEK